MCIIIYQDRDVEIPETYLYNSWVNNDDGAGYAYISPEDDLPVVKKFMKYSDFYDSYSTDWLKYGEMAPFVVHFRIGTQGPNDLANAHPHVINSTTVLTHNGILFGYDKRTKKDTRSDTRIFIDEVLEPMSQVPGWLDNNAFREMIEEHIGSGNKLVIMTSDPTCEYTVYIFNQDEGHWEDEKAERSLWFSNDSYKKVKWPNWASNVKYGWSNDWDSGCETDYPVKYKPMTLGEVEELERDVALADLICNWCEGDLYENGWCQHCECCNVCGEYCPDCACEQDYALKMWSDYKVYDLYKSDEMSR